MEGVKVVEVLNSVLIQYKKTTYQSIIILREQQLQFLYFHIHSALSITILFSTALSTFFLFNYLFLNFNRYLFKKDSMRKNNLKYHWYGDTYTEKDILKGAEDVSSRQELMELAQEEEPLPRINWEKWDELVTKTKQDITKELKKNKPIAQKNGRIPQTVYVYNSNERLIKTFSSTQEAADYYHIRKEQVTNYAREQKLYYKLQIMFRTKPI